MKRITVIAAVAGFGLGGLVGALAFFAWPLPGRGERVGNTKPSGMVGGGMAVSER